MMAPDVVETMNNEITIDVEARTIRLFGVNYSTDLFRTLALGPIGSVFRIVSREDGVVTLATVRGDDDANS
jgi:hypothetical protein